jgi:carboxyl-terminal processing protease
LVFKFLKKNGKTVEVSLLKEIIENAENSIEGYILQGKHKIGYVYIPDFYTSDTDTLQSGCSVDLARALVELKAENIESLIVDLRDNTGGSVQEAADMCGLFSVCKKTYK